MSKNTLKDPKVIVALDFVNQQDAEAVIGKLKPENCRLKVGITLFTQLGSEWIQKIQNQGFEIFLDLKFHDIPFQVAGACYSAAELGVWMMNVHALGGFKMLKAAKDSVAKYEQQYGRRPYIIGVTLLTSLSQEEISDFGLTGPIEENVMSLAGLCYEAGLDGVVCSAQEVEKIKSTLGQDFMCVTPGIRLAEDACHDQSRIVTPERAIRMGSDFLVMGRSITEAGQPVSKLQSINEGIWNELD
tara:strand:- start:23990 stop:24721 length:732 start_codon:yes stop_codon:yes gene_type:complete